VAAALGDAFTGQALGPGVCGLHAADLHRPSLATTDPDRSAIDPHNLTGAVEDADQLPISLGPIALGLQREPSLSVTRQREAAVVDLETAFEQSRRIGLTDRNGGEVHARRSVTSKVRARTEEDHGREEPCAGHLRRSPGKDDNRCMSTAAQPLRRNVANVHVVAMNDGVRSERTDTLAAEEPLEIRVQGPGQELRSVAVTMRTPGGDFELAVGFLFTEGLITPADVSRVAYCDTLPGEDQRYNIVSVTLMRPFDFDRLKRNFYATSSCGVCGKAALDDIEVRCAPVATGTTVDAATLLGLPDALRRAQKVFERTGGLHAAGLFAPDGRAVSVREDVGRHNAVDKVVGEQVLARRVPLADHVLQVSGRLSFEIVQKAAVAGIPVVSAVSAPSSLAVEAGERFGMTLVGFVRDDRLNVYTHPERVGEAAG
jgi:FdhD protein